MSYPQDYETPSELKHQSEYVNFQPADYEQFTLQQRASEPHLYQVVEQSSDIYDSVHTDTTVNIENENSHTADNTTNCPAKNKSITPPVDYHDQRENATPKNHENQVTVVECHKILAMAIGVIGVLVLIATTSIAIAALIQIQELRSELDAQRITTAEIQALNAGLYTPAPTPTSDLFIAILNSTLYSEYYRLNDSISNSTQSLSNKIDAYTENYENRSLQLEEIIKSVPQCEVIERSICSDLNCQNTQILTENMIVLESTCSNGGELRTAPTSRSCSCSNQAGCTLRVVRCTIMNYI